MSVNWARTSLTIALATSLGLPGCDLLVSPDLLEVIFTSTGVAVSSLRLPNSAVLVGFAFHHQMVCFELDAALSITAVTSTNGLTLTIGAF